MYKAFILTVMVFCLYMPYYSYTKAERFSGKSYVCEEYEYQDVWVGKFVSKQRVCIKYKVE